MKDKPDDKGKANFKYQRLSLVQTKKGMSYFGLHNEDYSTSKNQEIDLYAVKLASTERLNLAVIATINSIAGKLGILKALEIPRKEIFSATLHGEGPAQFFQNSKKVTIPRSKIERIVEMPDYHPKYYAWNISLCQLAQSEEQRSTPFVSRGGGSFDMEHDGHGLPPYDRPDGH